MSVGQVQYPDGKMTPCNFVLEDKERVRESEREREGKKLSKKLITNILYYNFDAFALLNQCSLFVNLWRAFHRCRLSTAFKEASF